MRGVATGDGLCRAAFACRNHDEQFHDIVVDSTLSGQCNPSRRSGYSKTVLLAAALHDENILIAY
jgi:hypothetical protein